MTAPRPRKAKLPVPLEQEEAAVFWRWWKLIRKQHPNVLIFCIDHGQRLSYGQVKKAQARGYEGGVADYGVFVFTGQGVKAGFIELKRVRGGTVADNQKDFAQAAVLAGAFHFVARGAQAAITFVTDCVLGAK